MKTSYLFIGLFACFATTVVAQSPSFNTYVNPVIPGDHPDPTCTGGGCKTNDFWDVGVALRIGSGAISAGYTASQPRGPRVDDADRIDIYSLNAGYKVTPGLDIFGGVDWVDTRSQSEAQEIPVDTRFMLGTNLKF